MYRKPTKVRILLLALLIFAGGCGRNIYYYQTDGFSLKMQARPSDASAPVQGTMGFKERVALIVPKKSDGEALSLVSGFSFDKENTSNALFGAVHIRSALITGAAAAELEGKAANVGTQIAQLDGQAIPTVSEQAKMIVDKLDAPERAKLLDFINRTHCPDKLNASDEDKFFLLAKVSVYSQELCTDIKAVLEK